jgi:predicted amidohydrolase YtcJ
VAIHAVERPAIESACNAIEFAAERVPGASGRDRIEHCAVCGPALARRIAKLGIAIVTQPAFLYFHGDRYLETVPQKDLPDLYPLKTLIDNGVSVAASSDSPVDPPSPLIGIYSAVTRRAKTGALVSGEQAISPWVALRMHCRDAARAVLDGDARGTIAPGMAADLAVLSDDPTGVAPESIKDIMVKMTIVGGEIAWSA